MLKLKRMAAMVLSVSLMAASVSAMAQERYTMAGFDALEVHNWNNNYALERIEERSGIHFKYDQYTDETAWNQAKASMTKTSSELPDVMFKADLSQA